MDAAYRNHTMDGIRGCLALVVLLNHVLQACGSKALVSAGWGRGLDFLRAVGLRTDPVLGRWCAISQFLARRFVRLWPMYALGLGVGSLLLGIAPSAQQLFWLHLANADNAPVADPPTWSLAIEAWAMLAMPLIAWVGCASFAWLVIAFLGSFLLAAFNSFAIFAWFFFAGAWVSRFDLRLGLFEMKLPQWLGRISYPLYLIHVPIIWYMHLPLFVSVPLAFAAAGDPGADCRGLEHPGIAGNTAEGRHGAVVSNGAPQSS